MRMTKKEKADPHMSLRGLGAKDGFEIFRTAVLTVFREAGKVLPKSISDDSEVIVKVMGSTKDPDTVYHYRNVIFDCRDTQNWHFYKDRDTTSEWKRLHVAQDLIVELNTIKDKFQKEQINIEVRVNHINLGLN